MEEHKDEDFALMSELFYRDLDQPLQRIFLALDPVSLKTSRQVCKDWCQFIKRRIWGSERGSLPHRTLRSKLDHHWRHANPEPRIFSVVDNTERSPFTASVHCVSCDDSVVVCGMKNAEAKVFDIETLQLLKVLDCKVDGDGDSARGEVQQDIGEEVVCTVTEKGDVSVWSRTDWSLLYKKPHHGQVEVYGVKVVKDFVITGGCDGRIAVLKANGGEVNLVSMLGEGTVTSRPHRRGNIMEDEMMINHIDSDGVWILAGSSMKLNLWSVEDCQKVKCLDTEWINSLSLCYPFALTVGNAKGVVVWDLEKGEKIRNFGKEMFWQVHNNGKFFGASIADMPWEESKNQSVMLYNIGELTDAKLLPVNLFKRRKYLESGSTKVVSCSLNTSCLVTAQGRTVSVWDFWNCDQFEDDPDPEIPQLDNSEEDEDDEDDRLMAEADQNLLVAFNLLAENGDINQLNLEQVIQEEQDAENAENNDLDDQLDIELDSDGD